MENITITVFDREGVEHKTEAPLDVDLNLMELLKAMELPVEGTCGGMALCASCQVYVEVAPSHPLPEMSGDEEMMLADAFHVKKNSRLACQLKLTEGLDGLVVRLAPE